MPRALLLLGHGLDLTHQVASVNSMAEAPLEEERQGDDLEFGVQMLHLLVIGVHSPGTFCNALAAVGVEVAHELEDQPIHFFPLALRVQDPRGSSRLGALGAGMTADIAHG